MWIRSLSQEDPLEKEMETHSRVLAWEPWTEEPSFSGQLKREGCVYRAFPGGAVVEHLPAAEGLHAGDTGLLPGREARQPAPVFLPGESHGQRSLAGCGPWEHRVGHD